MKIKNIIIIIALSFSYICMHFVASSKTKMQRLLTFNFHRLNLPHNVKMKLQLYCIHIHSVSLKMRMVIESNIWFYLISFDFDLININSAA